MNEERQARERHNTIAFWLNNEEKRMVDARIEVSGMQKGEYYRASVLGQEITMVGGRYKSDRLARVLETLNAKMEAYDEDTAKQIQAILQELSLQIKR